MGREHASSEPDCVALHLVSDHVYVDRLRLQNPKYTCNRNAFLLIKALPTNEPSAFLRSAPRSCAVGGQPLASRRAAVCDRNLWTWWNLRTARCSETFTLVYVSFHWTNSDRWTWMHLVKSASHVDRAVLNAGVNRFWYWSREVRICKLESQDNQTNVYQWRLHDWCWTVRTSGWKKISGPRKRS